MCTSTGWPIVGSSNWRTPNGLVCDRGPGSLCGRTDIGRPRSRTARAVKSTRRWIGPRARAGSFGSDRRGVPAAAQRQDVRPLHDMTTPLTFQGRLTLEDVLDIQHYRWRVALRPAVRVLIALVAIPIALLSVENVYRLWSGSAELVRDGASLLLLALLLCSWRLVRSQPRYGPSFLSAESGSLSRDADRLG